MSVDVPVCQVCGFVPREIRPDVSWGIFTFTIASETIQEPPESYHVIACTRCSHLSPAAVAQGYQARIRGGHDPKYH